MCDENKEKMTASQKKFKDRKDFISLHKYNGGLKIKFHFCKKQVLNGLLVRLIISPTVDRKDIRISRCNIIDRLHS